jgi:hypothetical protein
MLHLLWSILNIGLLLVFFYYAYKATLFIRQRLGLFVSILFVGALLSFASSPRQNPGTTAWKSGLAAGTPEYKGFDRIKSVYLTLEKNGPIHIDLSLNCGQYNNDPALYPSSAGSTITGFVAGYTWTASPIFADTIAGNIQYHCSGILNWKLLGMTIYAEEKSYAGIIRP